jgi:hypothetical protein
MRFRARAKMPTAMPTVMPTVMVSLSALALAACTDFDDPTTILDLRVLAVITEPSEIILEVDTTDPANPVVNPASNLPVEVTPLVVNAGGEIADATYTIIGCPNNPFAAGPPMGGMGGGGAFPSGGARTTVGSAPCNELGVNTVGLQTTPVSGSVVVQPSEAALKAAFLADIFPDQFGNLHGGFDLGEPYVLTLAVEAAGEQLTVIKRVLYWARRIDDAHVPNVRPAIPELQTYVERDPDTFEPVGDRIVLDETDPPFAVPAGGTLWIEPPMAPAESYQTTIIDATTHVAVPLTIERETVRYAFYATAGTFQPARTSSELPPGFIGTGRVHLESEYRAPKQVPDNPNVRIFVVARDDRGGEAWIARTVQITPP